ncbi:hypothetical protein SAMN05421688_1509 [Poseidonocella pacifica]|uniref:Uncharacterized protein n=1 Tax=Poseidonocella pacifica TaxID=871651 RepID=A0A1I0WJQ8_9RHOB|nr:hypothetical protein [Poseidonocella pacifica]SFA88989.1 hypothetical protein SAMN05421688_1509 [Poseidonocella pacifica]
MMDKKFEDIDWKGLPREDRVEWIKRLYTVAREIASITGQHIEAIILAAIGPKVVLGTGYADNFRAGKISATRAQLIHKWIIDHHFERAHAKDKELFALSPLVAFERFIDHRKQPGGLQIVKVRVEFGIGKRVRDAPQNVTRLRMGQAYCLELTSDRPGFAIGFERYGKVWHPLALGESEEHFRIPVGEGVSLLPRDAKGKPAPLYEVDDSGEHRFVIVTSPDKRMATNIGELARRYEDKTLNVYEAHVLFIP